MVRYEVKGAFCGPSVDVMYLKGLSGQSSSIGVFGGQWISNFYIQSFPGKNIGKTCQIFIF